MTIEFERSLLKFHRAESKEDSSKIFERGENWNEKSEGRSVSSDKGKVET